MTGPGPTAAAPSTNGLCPAEPAPFRYAAVPAADRAWLAGAAEQVRTLAFRTAVTMIRAGAVLARVHDKLKHGLFSLWVETELPWSRAHAYRLIAVAEAFRPYVSHAETFKHGKTGIDPTALYMLARPEVPAGARSYAVELAAERRVTAADAREILSRGRTPVPTPAARGPASESKPDAGPAAWTPADEEPEPDEPAGPVGDSDADEPAPARYGRGVDPVACWGAVEELARTASAFHFTRLDETDGDDEPLWSLTVYRDDGPRNYVRRWLSDCFLAAAGREPMKWCPGCWKTHPAALFADNGDQPDGREPTCKRCSRKRLKAHKKRAKERKREGT